MDAATASRVAREAHLPDEAVRSCFTGTRELLTFVDNVVFSRLTQRLDRHDPAAALADPARSGDERRTAVENALAQILPIDEERRRDAKASLACRWHASAHPELEAPVHSLLPSMREGFPKLLAMGQEAGIFTDDLDIPLEAERLAALLDGLTVNALLHPTTISPETMRAVLRHHLASLRPTEDEN